MSKFIQTVIDNLVAKPATRCYPVESREPFAGSRGHLEISIEDCTFCTLCAKRCPVNAIDVTRAPKKSWTLDPYRCIICGYCVEACPKKCLRLDPKHGQYE